MSLIQKLHDDVKTALKGGDSFSVQVLRMVQAAVHNKIIEKRGAGQGEELTDSEVVEILKKEAKKRRDAAFLYRDGGRNDRADQEEKEVAYIERYLPAQLGRDEIAAIVEKALAASQDAAAPFGVIMKEVMKEIAGRADGKLVSEIIKEKYTAAA